MQNLLPLVLDSTDPAGISLTVLLTGLIVVFPCVDLFDLYHLFVWVHRP